MQGSNKRPVEKYFVPWVHINLPCVVGKSGTFSIGDLVTSSGAYKSVAFYRNTNEGDEVILHPWASERFFPGGNCEFFQVVPKSIFQGKQQRWNLILPTRN